MTEPCARRASIIARRLYNEFGELGAKSFITNKKNCSETEDSLSYWQLVEKHLFAIVAPINRSGGS